MNNVKNRKLNQRYLQKLIPTIEEWEPTQKDLTRIRRIEYQYKVEGKKPN